MHASNKGAYPCASAKTVTVNSLHFMYYVSLPVLHEHWVSYPMRHRSVSQYIIDPRTVTQSYKITALSAREFTAQSALYAWMAPCILRWCQVGLDGSLYALRASMRIRIRRHTPNYAKTRYHNLPRRGPEPVVRGLSRGYAFHWARPRKKNARCQVGSNRRPAARTNNAAKKCLLPAESERTTCCSFEQRRSRLGHRGLG